MEKDQNQKWFVAADINGFFGLVFDNLTVLSFLAGVLVLAFKFPADIIYTKIFPGTAFGVLLGDIAYTVMAARLSRRTGSAVTAIPLGLDTPSTIGVALLILGPAYLALKAKGASDYNAAITAWHTGMAVMVIMGLIKVALSFCGSWIQRIVPQAGLLGSLAGIGLALLGFMPLVDIFGMPVIGMIALGLILYNVVAKIPLPKNFSGVFTGILIGTVLYYILGPLGWAGGLYTPAPAWRLQGGLPLPTLGFLEEIKFAAVYLPIAVPFAVLTVIGGINVSESARVAGDNYSTRDILLVEAFATLAAGFCGGVAQSTPYIGHSAYKRMGSRAGYTLLTGIFVGLGGMFGLVSFFVELIPRAVLAPILIFVALDIIVMAFQACPVRHAPAVVFAYLPTIARLITIKLSNPETVPAEIFQRLLTLPGRSLPELLVTVALGNGFILTGMLWGAFLAELIDRRLKISAVYLLVLALFSLFGIIHSALPEGNLYLPWKLTGISQQVPYQFAAAYAGLAVTIILLEKYAKPELGK